MDPPDLDLVRRFQGGDQDAFVALMERHERRVFNLAYRMLGSHEDAREATQEAFLSSFRHLSRFRGDAAFSTWLHRIAVNACYDLIRRRPPLVSLDAEPPEPPPAPDHSDAVASAADVQRALLQIPEEFRAALVMHDVQDVPVQAIADALQIPVGTVKSRLHRGRVALGRALSGGAREPREARSPSKPPNP
jgi:RNA polymerase sigma-70 factor (ECF subfamily)